MQEDDFKSLAKIRLERSKELLEEAENLLQNGSYKSANNRAYYSIEKGLTALLAIKQIHTNTHKGCLKQFNLLFIHNNEYFDIEDYKIAVNAEKIRNASDYDDFYLADKMETEKQVESARKLYNKVYSYISKNATNKPMR